MRSFSRRRLLGSVSALATLASTTLLWATDAEAQLAQRGYAESNFEPSERGSDWFSNESLDLRGHGRFALGIVADHAYRPLIGEVNRDGNVVASVVRNQTILHMGGSVNVFDRLRVGVNVPLQVYAFGHTANVGGVLRLPPQHDQSIGDLRGSVDARIVGEYGDPFQFAGGVSLWVPTGQRNQFTSDGRVRFAPHLNVAGDIDAFAYAARIGFQYRSLDEVYIDTELGSTFTFGAASGVRLFDKRFLLGPEVYGQTVMNKDAFTEHGTPIEIMLSGHANIIAGLRAGAGIGTFIVHGYGAPAPRATLSLEFFPDMEKSDRDKDGIPDDEDACPNTAGVKTNDPKTNGCPPAPADRDGDGINDKEDACPDEPGVRSIDPKMNGCPAPPPDRDGDGVPDAVDACPDVPGVKTNDPKTNGCPADRDGDGIIDKEDACPDVAGIKTNDPKTNGCPDTDRDKDGVLNDIDACPDVAGPKSQDPRTNGCPRVFIKNDQIQIQEQPKFDFNKSAIKPESDGLLTEVAQVMKEHAEIKFVRVEGHTDSVGNAAVNKKLSEQRAQAVVKWLNSHGVEASRLGAVGMGKEHPLVSNDTEANRALNRRVEFHIENQAPTGKEVTKTPQGTVTTPVKPGTNTPDPSKATVTPPKPKPTTPPAPPKKP